MKKTLLLFVILLSSVAAWAQRPVQATLMVNPPYTNLFSDYLNTNKVQLFLSGNARVRITGTLTSNTGVNLTLPVNPEYYVSKGGIYAITVNKNQQLVTTQDLKQAFSTDFTIDNSTQNLKLDAIGNYILPEGDYKLCVTIYGANENGNATDYAYKQLSDQVCAEFTITNIEAPFLLQPEDKQPIANASTTYQPLQFTWTGTAGVLPNRIKYNLQIAELLPNQNAFDAFRTGPLFADIEVANGSPTYLYKASDPKFEIDKTYAWRVIVSEKNPIQKYYTFQNQGLSQVSTFQYGSAVADAGFSIVAAYPKNNRAMPFRGMPLVVQYAPYKESYKKFAFKMKVWDENNNEIGSNEATNDWSNFSSPAKAQQFALKGVPVDDVLATYLPLSLTEGTAEAKLLAQFEKHRIVKWGVNAIMTDKLDKFLNGSCNSQFVAGMDKPVLKVPAADAKMSSTGEFTFEFETSKRPADEDLFPFDITQAQNGTIGKYKLSVNEKYVMEIATTKDFKPADIKATQTGKLTINSVDIKNATQLADLTYATISHKITIPAEGKYYWRVKWLTDPNADATSPHYAASEARSFCVGKICKDSIPPPPVMAECGGCKFPAIQDITEVKANLAETKTFWAGGTKGYKILVNKITDASSGKGEGIATILGLPMQVTFEGVKLNKDSAMFAGKVMSKKNNSGIPSLMPDATLPNKLPDFDQLTSTNGLTPNLIPNPAQLEAQAKALQTELKNRWTKVTDYISQTTTTLKNAPSTAGWQTPMGFSQNVGGVDITTAFENFLITPTNAQFDVMAVVESKADDIVVPFGFKGACIGIEGECQDYTLYLYKNMPISNLTLIGGPDPKKATHVVYNTKEGFKQINIYAEYEFKQDIIKRKDDSGKVIATLKAQTPNGFSDWVAKVSMPAFKVTGMEDLDFELVGEATYDHSDKENPAGMDKMLAAIEPKLPNNDKGDVALLKENVWNGFYLPKLKVTLPEIFKADQKDRVNVTVENFVIDKRGVSGSLVAKNAIGIGDGNMAGWYFSLDNFNVTFFNNVFIEAAADGKIVLPISGDDKSTPLSYKTTLTKDKTDSQLKYQFVIKPDKNDVNASIWWAKIKLKESSNITISVGIKDKDNPNGDLVAAADLNGAISFTPKLGAGVPKFSLDLLEVEHLKIMSKEPYIKLDSLKSDAYKQGADIYKKASDFVGKLSSPQKSIGGFPLTLDDFSPVMQNGKVGFYFLGKLKLSDSDLLPEASVGLVVLANVKLEGLRPKFSFDKIKIQEVGIKGQLGPVAIEGSVNFFDNDPKLGEGFKGNLKANISKGTLQIDAQAMFGSKDFNYWYLYLAMASDKVPIQVGPVTINGIGGGAYHNMTPPPIDAKNFVALTGKNYDYVPNRGTDGAKASIYFSVASQYIFKAKATLEANMTDGALNEISITGDGQLIGDGVSDKGMLNAKVRAAYDFPNKIFRLDAGVNGGMTGVTVEGQLNVLSDFTNKKYYLKIGEPQKRNVIDFLRIAKATGYFMVGNDEIPDIPEPPADIISPETIADFKRAGYKGFGLTPQGMPSGFEQAAGMAFGATLKVGSEVDFLMFWAKLKAGGGFDVNIRQLNGAVCQETGKEIGINSWYASGQAYFEFVGGVGVHTFFGDVKIVELKAAALIGAGLPNPTWFQGFVRGEGTFLGASLGFTLPLKIGERCTIKDNPFKQPLIADVLPRETTKVDVMSDPEIVLNYPRKFDVNYEDRDGNWKNNSYELKPSVRFKKGSGRETTITDANAFSYPGDKNIIWDLDASLDPRTTYTVTFGIDVWENGKVFSDPKSKRAVRQDTMIKFTTDECIKVLREEDMAYNTPFKDQSYYLQGESNQAFLMTRKKINCLFDPAFEYNVVIKHSRKSTSVPVTFENNMIRYTMPKLPNSTLVEIQLVKQPKQQYLDTFRNQNTWNTNLYVSNNDYLAKAGMGNVSNNDINQNLANYNTQQVLKMERNAISKQPVVKPRPLVLYSYRFSTSKFNTFTEKMAKVKDTPSGQIAADHGISIYFQSGEGFDERDVSIELTYRGSDGKDKPLAPLISTSETNNRWYDNVVARDIQPKWNNVAGWIQRAGLINNDNVNFANMTLNNSYGLQFVPDDNSLYLFNTRVYEIVDQKMGYIKNWSQYVIDNSYGFMKWVDDVHKSKENSCCWGACVCSQYTTIRANGEKSNPKYRLFSDAYPDRNGATGGLNTKLNELKGFDMYGSFERMLPLTPTLTITYRDAWNNTRSVQKKYTVTR